MEMHNDELSACKSLAAAVALADVAAVTPLVLRSSEAPARVPALVRRHLAALGTEAPVATLGRGPIATLGLADDRIKFQTQRLPGEAHIGAVAAPTGLSAASRWRSSWEARCQQLTAETGVND